MDKVIVYTTSNCPWCRRVKDYLKANHVYFEEVDVSLDPQAAVEMVYKSGQRGVPVLDIDNNIIVGFNKKSIDGFLGLY
jgi:glutaredoxin 3